MRQIPLHRALDEVRQIFFQLRQRRQMNVHHMPRLVIFHRDVLANIFIQAEMIERVFGREIWRAEIVISVRDKDLEIRIERHCLAKGLAHIHVLILEFSIRPWVDKLTRESHMIGLTRISTRCECNHKTPPYMDP